MEFCSKVQAAGGNVALVPASASAASAALRPGHSLRRTCRAPVASMWVRASLGAAPSCAIPLHKGLGAPATWAAANGPLSWIAALCTFTGAYICELPRSAMCTPR
jgi:hypothetical protein